MTVEKINSLTWTQVLAWRAERHGLLARASAREALPVASRILGLHAQLMSSAELSLWARVEALDPGWISAALWEERSLVKTWATRGTLHLLGTAELGGWLGALGTYRHYRKPAWYRAFEITEAELDALCEAVTAALDGPPLTRDGLAAAVVALTGIEHLGDKVRHGFGVYLKPAAFQGRLCFAPNDGRNVRFTRPDRWVGARPDSDGAAALSAIARRYLYAYAPATRDDLGRWLGVSPAEAGRLLRGLGDAVETVDVEGTEAVMPAGAANAAAGLEPAGALRLLPAFDQLVVGATRRGLVTPVERRDAVYRPQGWISPVIAVDGRMAGTWRHERKGTRIEVELEPWQRVDRGAAEAEAESLAAFLGGSLSLRWA